MPCGSLLGCVHTIYKRIAGNGVRRVVSCRRTPVSLPCHGGKQGRAKRQRFVIIMYVVAVYVAGGARTSQLAANI